MFAELETITYGGVLCFVHKAESNLHGLSVLLKYFMAEACMTGEKDCVMRSN